MASSINCGAIRLTSPEGHGQLHDEFSFSGVEVTVRNTVDMPVQDVETHHASPKRNAARSQAVAPVRQPVTRQRTTTSPKLPLHTRLLWSSTFVVAATLSATVGATVAMISPLPKFLHVLHLGEEVATAGTAEEDPDIPSLLGYTIERPVNILVVGIDRVLEAEVGSPEAFEGHTDTMLLIRFDPGDQSVKMLSIPRDTQVPISGIGVSKINDANVQGGADLLQEVVSDTLNGVPIDRYVRVTNDAFRELVDLVGGIEVYVPKDMKYSDKTQGLEIDLKKGLQRLNGDQAEQFARFRKDEFGDISRIQRQQVLLKALRERLQSPSVVPKLPKAVKLMFNYVDTNLSFEEVLALVNFGMNLQAEKLEMVLLPGRFGGANEFGGVSYWVMSRPERDRVLETYFDLPPDYERQERSVQGVRIALQNAAENPQLTRQVAQQLRAAGFRNLFYSNYTLGRKLRETEIVVQQGNRQAAEAIQDALGLGQLQADSTGDLSSDITIRVGADWAQRQNAGATD